MTLQISIKVQWVEMDKINLMMYKNFPDSLNITL